MNIPHIPLEIKKNVIESVIFAVFLSIALGAGYYLNLANPYWVAVACIAVMQGSSARHIFLRSIQRVIGTLIGVIFCWEILLRDIEKLKKSILIVMDNARFHRKNILEKIIKGTGHCLLFLPPYSPDLNPIEKLWANMKKKLKDIAHNFNTLEEAVTSVLFNKLVQF